MRLPHFAIHHSSLVIPLPSLITFDLGGTLIAPHPSVGETYAEILRAHGFPASAGRLNGRFPAALKQWQDQLGPRQAPRDERGIWARIVRETIAEEAVPDGAFDSIFEDLFQAYASGDRWRILPHATEVLPALAGAGYRLAVLSNSDSRMRRVLDDLGLSDFFEAIFLSSEIGYEKPDPQLFAHVQQVMELAPEAILHVGDSDRHDRQGAEAAAWRAFLVGPGQRSLADLPTVL